ncbi:lysophospholipid acyltransferase family protein [Solemya velum gill symbiont]|uniref:DUF374 domain-containing protein n=1 Tax=Solemya velum gill symbiont TaxID=2340 RepID=A0A1T2FI97_SOVGS|nr:lysophospholipid acyltransferase family protein [Solemya velum gill symbiont]OOY36134.1 hypothetical protein BOV88_00610 [Solemya velum gill symbiont]OOY38160.1 hypothetical protein BOV89_03470 [Solemya velum gill symbiont]OOY43687.1 hypothetical protein BOV91_03315 [Solemya velum gill symbiont]OOY45080.1 hypothetical protein BOV92_06755 [Solemya velum gill symbiont]OOY48733.1 hypothetical protein BOV93_01120 [Solemya velum gill symbiont]
MMQDFKFWFYPILYKWVVMLLMATYRVEYIGREQVDRLKSNAEGWIYSSWHENVVVSQWAERNQGLVMMSSDSKDGEFSARVMVRMGNFPVRGSSSHGGMKAARAVIQALKSGSSAGMTPDGPRGPARKAKPGMLFISAVSNCPIIPYHVVSDRYWSLTSWDKQRIPKPFSRVIICIGEPLRIDKQRFKQDEAGLIVEVEEAMQQNVERAEEAISA